MSASDSAHDAGGSNACAYADVGSDAQPISLKSLIWLAGWSHEASRPGSMAAKASLEGAKRLNTAVSLAPSAKASERLAAAAAVAKVDRDGIACTTSQSVGRGSECAIAMTLTAAAATPRALRHSILARGSAEGDGEDRATVRTAERHARAVRGTGGRAGALPRPRTRT